MEYSYSHFLQSTLPLVINRKLPEDFLAAEYLHPPRIFIQTASLGVYHDNTKGYEAAEPKNMWV